MKKCCIVGHRTIEIDQSLIDKIRKELIKMIEDENIYIFLFGSQSMFTTLCYDIISQLKQSYKQLCRVFIRAEYPIISSEYESYLKTFYEETYFYNKHLITGKLSYIKRDQVLIDKSDICLFFYNKHYTAPKNTRSGTELAYQYAVKKKKNIINVYG